MKAWDNLNSDCTGTFTDATAGVHFAGYVLTAGQKCLAFKRTSGLPPSSTSRSSRAGRIQELRSNLSVNKRHDPLLDDAQSAIGMERPKVVLPESVRTQLQHRMRFGRL